MDGAKIGSGRMLHYDREGAKRKEVGMRFFTRLCAVTAVAVVAVALAASNAMANDTVVIEDIMEQEEALVEEEAAPEREGERLLGTQSSAAHTSIAKAQVAKIGSKQYTGKAIKPRPTVTYGNRTLKRGRDYTLSYKNNKRVGKATIVISGKGSYRGTKKVTFQIVRKPLLRGPKKAGALSVRNGRLVDKNGKAIQLRGVSTHGLAWFGQYVNDACFEQLRNTWGANVVRLAMYTQEYGGYCSGGSKKDLKALVRQGVDYAKTNDLYVIVDWHILSDGNPLTHASEAKAFFRQMSAALKGYNNVIYEICNEPNGGTSWNDIKKYAKKVIPAIRANDKDAIVLVGTPTWSQEIDKAAASPLAYKNVMYTMHFYAGTHKDDLRQRLVDALDSGLPVFVSEFGICDASGNGNIDKASANAWLKVLNKRGVSWCMWSLCNKEESASMIKGSVSKTAGFSKSDLTTSGKWLVSALGK